MNKNETQQFVARGQLIKTLVWYFRIPQFIDDEEIVGSIIKIWVKNLAVIPDTAIEEVIEKTISRFSQKTPPSCSDVIKIWKEDQHRLEIFPSLGKGSYKMNPCLFPVARKNPYED